MNNIWDLLPIYTALAFGMHGGEFITGINRQIRNLLCALPFGLVAWYVSPTMYDFPIGLLFFTLAYIGTNMSFDRSPLWFKGLVTFPLGGFVLLPLAYIIGYNTKWTNVMADALSGLFYGLALLVMVKYVP